MPMNRTMLIKSATLALLLAVALGIGIAIPSQSLGAPALIAMAVVFLLPGRVQGVLWRDLLTGRRLYARGQYAEALPHFDRFLAQVDRRPALRHAIWLGWSFYTLKPDVMALTNSGACNLMIGDLDQARSVLEEAIRRDPLAPLPHVNMALMHHAKNEPDRRDACLARARELGFRRTWSDAVAQQVMSAYAAIEGRTTGPS